MLKHRALIVVPAALVLVATSSLASPGSSGATPVAAPKSSCAPTSGKMLTLPVKKAGEPKLSVPQPAGWQRETSQDNDLIRAAIVNTRLVANGFAPNAVVTLENAGSATGQQLLDAQLESLKQTINVKNVTTPVPGTLCGFPTTTFSYSINAVQGGNHRATVTAVAIPSGGSTWGVTVTVQSTEPDNAAYKRDSQAILKGLQITP